MFVLENQRAVIKVIGVGGAGGNAVEHMLSANLTDVEFIIANTDAQALSCASSGLITKLQLGENITRGLGAGADPEIGRKAALEMRDGIVSALEGADMVFIAAGMGGGTGTGAAPVVAEVAHELKILSVAVVTRPFKYEGVGRNAVAEDGIAELQKQVDSLIIIPNEKIREVAGGDENVDTAFGMADQVLLGAVKGISDLITKPGKINLDFADVKTVMSAMGMAVMGSATASGENRAEEAVQMAISSPFLEDDEIEGAKGILVNITGGPNMSINEFENICKIIREYDHQECNMIIGMSIDTEMVDEISVTVVATGLTFSTSQKDIGLVESLESTEELGTATKKPQTLRQNQPLRMAAGTRTYDYSEKGMEQYDLPHWLRMQAD
ncbi:MAG: cell division protein FtsZ [Gammaproteobacteria bacterium]|nr:cell division protein FtsZ [Gammaproteobacteria bacterium]MCY4218143.1 cell division protein FtsZ [Gammaproteobacteria bacterium]MCY4275591.1 cell division protein FtsZ [Gammaproteobacteria bacterium]